MNIEQPHTIRRSSYMEIGKIYFWTATIRNWIHLMKDDKFKQIVISSLEFLSDKGLVDIFCFVIMPNHIHLIWRLNELNGKETPQGSFLKYTAHEFKKILKEENGLSNFYVNASNKRFEFWQRDSLAIHLYTKEVAFQKMDYIHNNPCQDMWNLVEEPHLYQYSSDSYYHLDDKKYKFLRDLRDEF
jgi:putative transposase